MRPQGHLAGGAIAGALLSRRHSELPAVSTIVATALAANVPDLDVFLPIVLRGLGIESELKSCDHHAWASHSAFPWALATPLLYRHHRRAAQILGAGVAVHLLQDMISSSVVLAWPSRRRYGIELDGLGTTSHREFMRLYPGTPAGKLERVLIVAALLLGADTLRRARN